LVTQNDRRTDVIRAFIGVRVDPIVIQRMSDVAGQLKPHLPGLRWVAAENLHFTLKFLGSIKEEQIALIVNALDQAVRPFPRFTINAKGLGVFPELKRARVLWVGLEGSDLRTLASRVETVLEPLGFTRETRAFAPHLTIGRWRPFDGSPAKLGDVLEPWRGYEFGPSAVENVTLFQSVLDRHGATYHAMKIVSLDTEPGV
jgi:2'-5' RNA ligase